ncbi:hypothetical protein HZS_110 [Henneguya salminicola]|nr:hypothetical protein HZS_110 [Henneguya salminicola]
MRITDEKTIYLILKVYFLKSVLKICLFGETTFPLKLRIRTIRHQLPSLEIDLHGLTSLRKKRKYLSKSKSYWSKYDFKI